MLLAVKNPPVSAGDERSTGAIPVSGRSPGGEHGKSRQHSYLENPIDSGAPHGTVHRVAKSQTRLKPLNTHTERRKS